VDAVAVKGVHADPRHRGTFLIDDGVVRALEEFLPTAPAHNTIYLTGIPAFRESLPGTPLVAAFETEFHRTAGICAPVQRAGDWPRRVWRNMDFTARRISVSASGRRRCSAVSCVW
jgi:hypothetical protein